MRNSATHTGIALEGQGRGHGGAARARLDGVQARPHADPVADRQRADEAHAIEPVVHGEGEVLEAHQLGQQLRRERERVKPVRDRAAEPPLPRACDIRVDPLVIASRVGEPIHVVLRDGLPAACADLLPHMHGELIDAAGRDHAYVPFRSRWRIRSYADRGGLSPAAKPNGRSPPL
jgi:hypothetical protein